MEVSDADRVLAADILDEVSDLLDHVGIGQVADLIRDGEYDKHSVTEIVARHRATQAAELEALRGEVERLDTTPWKDFHGDLPDYDHPLRCVYESGIQYAVNLLAATLKVDDWEVCDGTEEFDGDLGGTLFNIVLAALPTDQHGDPMHPSEIAATIAQLRARVAALEELLRDAGTTSVRLEHSAGWHARRRALLTQNEVG